MADANGEQRQQAVVVHLKLSDEGLGAFDEREKAFALEDRLEEIIAGLAIGEYDGHEFGEGWCRLYIYGDDANRIGEAIIPVVRDASPPPGTFLVKRFGPPGARQEEVPL